MKDLKIANAKLRRWGNHGLTLPLPKMYIDNSGLVAGGGVTVYLTQYKRKQALLIVPESDVRRS
ncbi:MAG: hypothetical protein IPJ03_17020 [Ignavibacteriales bacterium]|nr:hypothetical protein [Ignavibacteriales bacterium]